MGRILYSFKNLKAPFEGVEDRYLSISAGQVAEVQASFRIVFFLGDPVEIELPDGTRVNLGEGDALSARNGSVYHLRTDGNQTNATCRVLVVRFLSQLQEMLVQTASEGFGGESRYIDLFGKDVRIFPKAIECSPARSIIELIQKEGEKKSPPDSLLINGLCMALVSCLFDRKRGSLIQEGDSAGRKRAAMVEHAKHFIQENRPHNSLCSLRWCPTRLWLIDMFHEYWFHPVRRLNGAGLCCSAPKTMTDCPSTRATVR